MVHEQIRDHARRRLCGRSRSRDRRRCGVLVHGIERRRRPVPAEGPVDLQETLKPPHPRRNRTPVSENEINAYLQFYAADQLPPGVVDPEVQIHGQGRLSGHATIDLDAIKHLSPDSWAGALMLLGGDRLPISATGVLHTKDGIGRLQIEQVELSGLPVPTTLLQELVSRYSRTPDNPDGARLDDPFTLPARIREIQIEEGRAIIVQ